MYAIHSIWRFSLCYTKAQPPLFFSPFPLGCYGISESHSTASTESSASTEPWFCDACKAGVSPVSFMPFMDATFHLWLYVIIIYHCIVSHMLDLKFLKILSLVSYLLENLPFRSFHWWCFCYYVGFLFFSIICCSKYASKVITVLAVCLSLWTFFLSTVSCVQILEEFTKRLMLESKLYLLFLCALH